MRSVRWPRRSNRLAFVMREGIVRPRINTNEQSWPSPNVSATGLDDLAALGPLNRRVASAVRYCAKGWAGADLKASRAVHDPLSCCLDMTSGEMLDLR